MRLHDNPLDGKISFQALDIDSFWGQSVSMRPMFSDSASQGAAYIRSTQTHGLQFSQTQVPEGGLAEAGGYLVSSFMPEGGATQLSLPEAATSEGGRTIRPSLLLAERGSQASMGLTSFGSSSQIGWSGLKAARTSENRYVVTCFETCNISRLDVVQHDCPGNMRSFQTENQTGAVESEDSDHDVCHCALCHADRTSLPRRL